MHENYHSFEADSHYSLGLKMGIKFKKDAQRRISEVKKEKDFPEWRKTAAKMLRVTEDKFPDYVDELKGYADGANIDFADLWTLAVEDDAEIKEERPAKCTTLITNNGKLLAHSEDWMKGAGNNISLVKKTIDGLTTLEIYYICTLGCASVGVNSNGFAVATNTLFFTPTKIGIPKCIPARILLDTKDPVSDYEKIKKLNLADGYSHNIIDVNGEIINMEFSSQNSVISRPKSPFVHSNHCLILSVDKIEDDYGTVSRLNVAQEKISAKNTISEIEEILEDGSLGSDKSINNERTVGRMIVDFEKLAAHIWLLREKEKGWIEYPLDFIKK